MIEDHRSTSQCLQFEQLDIDYVTLGKFSDHNSKISFLFLGLHLNLQKASNYLLEFLANENNILKLEDNKHVINS